MFPNFRDMNLIVTFCRRYLLPKKAPKTAVAAAENEQIFTWFVNVNIFVGC